MSIILGTYKHQNQSLRCNLTKPREHFNSHFYPRINVLKVFPLNKNTFQSNIIKTLKSIHWQKVHSKGSAWKIYEHTPVADELSIFLTGSDLSFDDTGFIVKLKLIHLNVIIWEKKKRNIGGRLL